MEQKTIEAIAEDAIKLHDALEIRLRERGFYADDLTASAMPAIVEYETREGK
jgi:hypothetical protein